MNQINQTQDTDYSSDSDSFFTQSVFKAPQNTDRLSSKSSTRLKHQTAGKQEIFNWATRLELESITLKDTIKNELIGSMTQVCDTLGSLTDKVSVKLNNIETCLQSIHTTSPQHNQLEIDKILQKIDIKINANNEMMMNEIKSYFELWKSHHLEQNIINDTKLKSLTDEVQLLSKLVKTCSTKITNTQKTSVPTQIQKKQDLLAQNCSEEIKEIKQYLKLLLPRMIGIENYYKDLALTYSQLKKNTIIPTTNDTTTKSNLPLIKYESPLVATEPETEADPEVIPCKVITQKKIRSRKRRKIL
ncbi:hypothetical protein DFJ63DRAFT_185156 [Scheffersomyces coipomensis]|uniref:uncharacterized protein n=1 Tax=Scheffersomyces coipomensis TaxID=1788519 RepID=UPI00315CEC41